MERELTRTERTEIRKLVKSMCANYDRENGCLPLVCPCYMLDKWWTGAYCRYFREAVLPLNPALEASLTGTNSLSNYKPCAVCGEYFIGDGRHHYCSSICAEIANKRAAARRAKKYRKNKRSAVTNIPKKVL